MDIINIITPCIRPENLLKISQSINIPRENYRWIVVFDLEEYPNAKFIPDNCEAYIHKNSVSCSGNAQRNYAIDLIEKGHVYMNDDDTLVHPDLWENVVDLNQDFISFSQEQKDGSLRLTGDNYNPHHIDSHNFIVSRRLIGEDKWQLDRYDADGCFAHQQALKTLNSDIFTKIVIPKVLSVYNALR